MEGPHKKRKFVESRPDQNEYTIGWTCALSIELAAARAILDEKYEEPDYVDPSDDNAYVLGRIGKHKVVIAGLPKGEYGIASSASVARDMLHSFPNIKCGLMVGIGGGAPSEKHDIRLGDIVVSSSGIGHGGVLQYDFGKTIQDQAFQTTGHLNKPPKALLTAMGKLETEYMSEGHQLESTIDGILEAKPKLRKHCKRPTQDSDRLYKSTVVHPHSAKYEESCVKTCGNDSASLVSRPERTEDDDNPMIHYGLIASANQLMKDASLRDWLALEKDVLCFEMEAAGLMNNFPCLVIRGICDYADSHKNKMWQGYAALVAAVYAKDLLRNVHPRKIEVEKKIVEVLNEINEISRENRDIAQEQLNLNKVLVQHVLSNEEQKVLHLFRLSTTGKDSNYEWFKDRVEDRLDGTCNWFLQHENWQKWLLRDFGPLLVSADPGCGKSVLAKYLVDHVLPGICPRPSIICYFFFKVGDQNTVCQALCAVLHQILVEKPTLIQYAMERYKRDGKGFINTRNSLWAVLSAIIQDPRCGPVTIVLDALDECAEPEVEDLMRSVSRQFSEAPQLFGNLKYIFTTRPYDTILREFGSLVDDFPGVRIPGEEESETISQEINRVIVHRTERLARERGISESVRIHLEQKLLETPHRTYLWVYLVFDHLRLMPFKKTNKGVDSMFATLPMTVNEAYEEILSRSQDSRLVRKLLSIILAAQRPLTLSELNVAFHIDVNIHAVQELDLEDDNDFQARIRALCGLFVSVHQSKVYFLHQTAQEFLLNSQTPSTGLAKTTQWHESINYQDAHRLILQPCILYLSFFFSDPTPPPAEAPHFWHYASKFWSLHFRETCLDDERDDALMCLALGLCDEVSEAYCTWFCEANYAFDGKSEGSYPPALITAAWLGLNSIIQSLITSGVDIESRDFYDQTPLICAAKADQSNTAELLLKLGADIDAKDDMGNTALSYATEFANLEPAKLLIMYGANVNECDSIQLTPLHHLLPAKDKECLDIAELLLESGADVDAQSYNGQTPLHYAAYHGTEDDITLLLDYGANINIPDSKGQTPLLKAVERGRETNVAILLERGAKLDAKDHESQTAISLSKEKGNKRITDMLVRHGSRVMSRSPRNIQKVSKDLNKMLEAVEFK